MWYAQSGAFVCSFSYRALTFQIVTYKHIHYYSQSSNHLICRENFMDSFTKRPTALLQSISQTWTRSQASVFQTFTQWSFEVLSLFSIRSFPLFTKPHLPAIFMCRRWTSKWCFNGGPNSSRSYEKHVIYLKRHTSIANIASDSDSSIQSQITHTSGSPLVPLYPRKPFHLHLLFKNTICKHIFWNIYRLLDVVRCASPLIFLILWLNGNYLCILKQRGLQQKAIRISPV